MSHHVQTGVPRKIAIIQTTDDEPDLNYLCAGLSAFFLPTAAPTTAQMAAFGMPGIRLSS